MQLANVGEAEVPIRFFREFWGDYGAECLAHKGETSGAVAPSGSAAHLLADYCRVRSRTEALAAPLSVEDQNVQSMPDASPTKWHLAHTTWFFEAVVLAHMDRAYEPFDPAFNYLFNSYYEGLGPRLPRHRRGLISRPALPDVMNYRAHVDSAMRELIVDNPDAVVELVILGLQHEQQHQELILTDIKHALFSNPLLPSYSRSVDPLAEQAPLSWSNHPGGVVQIGHAASTFAFDNECPRHAVYLQPFRMAERPISNDEYRAFIDDGGYRRPELWLSDGWAMIQREGIFAPLYWLRDTGGWSEFSLSGLQPLAPSAPVAHVSFYEAAAFASWAGARLPTEFEWEAAYPAARGAVWEWTRSSYDPYPGYRSFEGAVGEYNGKFMSGQMVLRGGSRATPEGHSRRTYRNFFPPSARWQFSGIRLAGDL